MLQTFRDKTESSRSVEVWMASTMEQQTMVDYTINDVIMTSSEMYVFTVVNSEPVGKNGYSKGMHINYCRTGLPYILTPTVTCIYFLLPTDA